VSALPFKLYDPEDRSGLTLTQVYQQLLPHLPLGMSPRSLVEHRTALRHWRSATGDPPVKRVDRDTVLALRNHMVGRELGEATVNKVWRTLRSFFRFAVEELREIEAIPGLSYRSRSKLLEEPTPVHREVITHAEVEQLWAGCLMASYPRFDREVITRLWRTFIVLLYTYGMRSGDLIRLPRSAILFNTGRIRWVADKTNKLQGLPLTDVVRWHLEQWLAVYPSRVSRRRSKSDHEERLFPGLYRAGHFNTRSGRWSPGFYTTWRTEIAADVRPEVHWQNFRQTMVSEMNDIHDGTGGYLAGHSRSDVTGKSYDQPSKRVRSAIAERPVPRCFLWGLHDEPITSSPAEDACHRTGAALPRVE